jgi:hypothetical protein
MIIPWLKMSSPGVRAAMRLVRSVQSGPLEIRIATLLRKSATDRYPSGCPAKTFKIVIWKLTVEYRLRGGRFYAKVRAPSSRGTLIPGTLIPERVAMLTNACRRGVSARAQDTFDRRYNSENDSEQQRK